MRCLLLICYALLVALTHCLPIEDDDINNYERGGADLTHLGASVFRTPNIESGTKVEQWNETEEVNPEELGDYAEGDIVFPTGLAKNGLIASTKRWPQGVVPYEITGKFSLKDINLIQNAMEQYHRFSCIRFRLRKQTDRDWVSITSGKTGCWSSVGRIGGRQELNLQSPGCLSRIGTAIHEFLHALGFEHEQTRWERDSFVKIHWRNIEKGRERNFEKAGKDKVTGFGVPYDYGSVMHYSEKAFSKNDRPTITVLTRKQIGQRDGFSTQDLQKLKRMYNCPARTEGAAETDYGIEHSGQPNQDLN